MPNKTPYLLICGLAALIPFIPMEKGGAVQTHASAEWPDRIQNRPLERLSLTEKEKAFSDGFPGEIRRFTDGTREIIIRLSLRPTRKLHPAVDCFKANGYRTTPLPVHLDENEQRWSRFTASKGGRTRIVSERITDSGRNSWTDVSAWFWAASLKQTKGPWWAVTIAESGPITVAP